MTKKILGNRRAPYTAKVDAGRNTTAQNPDTKPTTPTTPSIEGGGCGGGLCHGSTAKVKELKNAVKELSADDLQHLLDHILLLQQQQTNKTSTAFERKLGMFTVSVTDAMSRALGGARVGFNPNYLPQAKKFLRALENFLHDCGMGNLTNPESKIFYNIYSKLLVQQAMSVSGKAKIPVSLKLVFQTTATPAGIIDAQFPGYAKGGLLRALILAAQKSPEQMREDHDDDE